MHNYEVRLFDKSGTLALSMLIAANCDDDALLPIRNFNSDKFAIVEIWRDMDLIYVGPVRSSQPQAA